MTGVLEAGAAGELILGGDKQQEIARILRLYTWIVAPRIYIYELTELLRGYNRRLGLSHRELAGVIDTASGLIDEYLDENELIPDALGLADDYGVSVSGGFYCAAAKARNGVIISLDGNLRSAARKAGLNTAESLS
jgi:predicted nucleic acid-binding protein